MRILWTVPGVCEELKESLTNLAADDILEESDRADIAQQVLALYSSPWAR